MNIENQWDKITSGQRPPFVGSKGRGRSLSSNRLLPHAALQPRMRLSMALPLETAWPFRAICAERDLRDSKVICNPSVSKPPCCRSHTRGMPNPSHRARIHDICIIENALRAQKARHQRYHYSAVTVHVNSSTVHTCSRLSKAINGGTPGMDSHPSSGGPSLDGAGTVGHEHHEPTSKGMAP
jgi:hypothetical protein